MGWTNFSVFAIGGILAGIPVLLHLLMKKRPRHQIFPAMRFLQQRQVSNKRQMRLRNWLLLAMRIAAILLLAALFARPTVDSAAMGYWVRALLMGVLAPLAVVAFVYSWLKQRSTWLTGSAGIASLLLLLGLAYFLFRGLSTGGVQNTGDANDPVAAVLVFDTSPRMGLVHENKSRLEEARVMARELMKQLPPESEVAVIDGANFGAFSVDLGVAATTVDALNVLDTEFPLVELINRGMQLVSDRDDKRKELYVFSEMSQQLWEDGAFSTVRERLEREQDVSLFVLDVGVEEPRNVRLGQVTLSADSLAKGQPLTVETEISSLNFDGKVDIEIALEEPDPTRPVLVDGKLLMPELSQRERKTMEVSSGVTAPVRFRPLKGIPSGVHHGQIRLRSSDGLEVDDVRYFTIAVRAPFPVLLVKFGNANPKAVKQVISPNQFELNGTSAYEVHIVEPNQLLEASILGEGRTQPRQLSDFPVVALLDPEPMSDPDLANSGTSPHWQELERYVRSGGSLVLSVGRNALPSKSEIQVFNSVAKNLLPADLKSYWRTAPGKFLFISIRNTSHPVLSLLRGFESTIAWDESPIYKHWTLDNVRPGANVIATYSNNQPFLIESAVGDGRVVLMTTPVSDDGQPKRWNDLPTAAIPLPFFMTTRGLFAYLTEQSLQPWNHTVGQTVVIESDSGGPDLGSGGTAGWQLVSPHGDWQNVRGEDGTVTVTTTEQVGTYRLKPSNPSELGIGFSTNLPSQATDVARLDIEKLDAILGENSHTLARGPDELNRGIGRARVGRELFPFLMLIVVGLLGIETLFSNRFYSTAAGGRSESKLRSAA